MLFFYVLQLDLLSFNAVFDLACVTTYLYSQAIKNTLNIYRLFQYRNHPASWSVKVWTHVTVKLFKMLLFGNWFIIVACQKYAHIQGLTFQVRVNFWVLECHDSHGGGWAPNPASLLVGKWAGEVLASMLWGSQDVDDLWLKLFSLAYFNSLYLKEPCSVLACFWVPRR